MDNSDLVNRFRYHAPTPAVAETHNRIRGLCYDLAYTLNSILPGCRETALAITHLEETMMWANAALARHPEI